MCYLSIFGMGVKVQRFGEKLRTLRKRHKMTTTQLTAALGFVNDGYISLLENGKRMPNVGIALKVSQLFNVTTDQLLRDDLELPDEGSEGR